MMSFIKQLSISVGDPMRASQNQPSTTEAGRSGTDRPRRATPKALVWLMIAALAAFPFPWWW
jgi:hypothetical protein